MVFTFSKRHFISLHFAKKRIKIDQVRAEIQLGGRPVRKFKRSTYLLRQKIWNDQLGQAQGTFTKKNYNQKNHHLYLGFPYEIYYK